MVISAASCEKRLTVSSAFSALLNSLCRRFTMGFGVPRGTADGGTAGATGEGPAEEDENPAP